MARYPQSLIEFQDSFRDEAACIRYLVKLRWPDGFVCLACGSIDAVLLKNRPAWQCRKCRRQTSLTAGTLMANTKLPIRTWFWAAYLMTTHSNGLSALQLSQQLGLNYRTAWLLEAKLRQAMVNPDRSLLTGMVEVDQTEIPFREKDPPDDVGGHEGMITVVGAVEVVDRRTGETPRWQPGRKLISTKPRRIRLQVIPDNTAATLEAFVRANVARGSIVLTDSHGSYNGLPGLGYRHYPYLIGPMAAHIVLPWIHRGFSLLKRWGLGVYHGLRRKHVQDYLDEYSFRFNRRRWRMVSFDKLLGLTAAHVPVAYHQHTETEPRKTAVELEKRIARGDDVPKRRKPKRRSLGKLDVVGR